MAIPSPSTPTFYANFSCTRAESARYFLRSPSTAGVRHHHRTHRCRLTTSSRLNSSKPSGAGGYVSPDNGDLQYELQHAFTPHRSNGSPVFVTLPLDVVNFSGKVRRWKTMIQSFRALAAAGVEGVVMEVWWGLVEREEPRVYNWQGYTDIVALARRCGLKVQAVMAFHQCGRGPGDPNWIPLPQWVLEEINRDPNLSFSDRFGRRNTEYISFGCDVLPVLCGRSPIQTYADFMRNFRDTFRPFLGLTITVIQVGMGPAGELRYPSCPSHKLTWAWRSHELGEFQCYDKYMLASLNACAREVGMHEWGSGVPIGMGNATDNPEHTDFFRSNGSWNTAYGKFFLEWYAGMLLLHGERVCQEAETIFRGIEVKKFAKVAGIPWHYGTRSHAAELTSGYYNTRIRDGYLPIIRMLCRYGFSLCSTCFEMQDADEKQKNPVSSPEGFLRQLLLDARICGIPLAGENSGPSLDDKSFQQVLKMSKFYTDGLEKLPFSFNFVRMDKNLFQYDNWVRFTRFVRRMSDGSNFRAKLDCGVKVAASCTC